MQDTTLVASSDRWLRWFLIALGVNLAVRVPLAAWLPFTGDEAYFHAWGLNPDWGFYDHPPMVGWWLAALAPLASALGESTLILRLPALLAPPLIAIMVSTWLARFDRGLALAAGALTLLIPLNAWNVAITTDVPLMIFACAAVVVLLTAIETGSRARYLAAGVLLGGALLSKYFAGMLALGMAAALIVRPSRERLVGLLLLIAGSLPAALVQIGWNSANCWPNVMFNLVNRHDNAGWSLTTPLVYLASLVYVLGPAVAIALVRPAAPSHGFGVDGSREAIGALRWIVGVPFGLFALLSAVKTIGLHWLAGFAAPAVILYALMRHRRGAQLTAALRFAAAFALVHYLLIIGLALVPLERWHAWKSYPSLVWTLAGGDVARAIEPSIGDRAVASSGYSPAVTLGFNLHRYVFVFGPGSSHARHDDILTDFRALAGRDILIVRKDADYSAADYEPYFERVTYRQLPVRGATMHLIEGQGFRYEIYRDRVLDEVRRRWYALPAWLPAGPCYFCDRYFPERSCHR